MSFPSSFAPQVAAIMDVLAKAAVAEITKLVEEGTVVLRLEICRRDGEIQELKRSLQLMEVELCKAQQAQEQAGKQHPRKDEKENQEAVVAYLEPKSDDSLCEPRRGSGSRDLTPAVKLEPEDEPAAQETADSSVTANISFEAGEREEPIWPPPVSASIATQQHLQIFSPHATHRNTECSFGSLSESTEDHLNVPIKVEVEMQPLCVRDASSESRQAPRLQSGLQQAGPAPSPPQRSAAGSSGPTGEAHVLSRNNLRAKRLVNVWRANQKLFICSVCNRGFARLSLLEEHKASHQPFKPFRCLECGKSFTQKTRLKTHQSVHTGERPFSCKICGKMFSRQDNCLRHERFHSGLRPYSCGQCGKSFTVLGNLKIHQEIHLQGR